LEESEERGVDKCEDVGRNRIYKQTGRTVNFSKLFGYIFIIAISSCLLFYVVGIWFSIAGQETSISIVASTFYYLVMIAGMAVFAVFVLWKFPDISTSDKGIDLKVFFYSMHVEWKNIVRTEKRKTGLFIFLRCKGLLLNRLYGLFDAKVWDQPVVLFVSDEELVNRLEGDIKEHLHTA